MDEGEGRLHLFQPAISDESCSRRITSGRGGNDAGSHRHRSRFYRLELLADATLSLNEDLSFCEQTAPRTYTIYSKDNLLRETSTNNKQSSQGTNGVVRGKFVLKPPENMRHLSTRTSTNSLEQLHRNIHGLIVQQNDVESV